MPRPITAVDGVAQSTLEFHLPLERPADRNVNSGCAGGGSHALPPMATAYQAGLPAFDLV